MEACNRIGLPVFNSVLHECSAFEDLRRDHNQLFGPEVAFGLRQLFAHGDQRAVVMYILGCLRLIEHAHD